MTKFVNFIFDKEMTLLFREQDIKTRLPEDRRDIYELREIVAVTSGTESLKPGRIVINLDLVRAIEFYEMEVVNDD